MDYLNEITECYDLYFEKISKKAQKLRAFDGFCGFGNDPKKAECHDELYENVEKIVTSLVSDPDRGPTEVYNVFYHILSMPIVHEKNELAYWMLFAATGHTRALVPALTKEEAQRLLEYFDKYYPKVKRLPVQQELYKMLKKRV